MEDFRDNIGARRKSREKVAFLRIVIPTIISAKFADVYIALIRSSDPYLRAMRQHDLAHHLLNPHFLYDIEGKKALEKGPYPI